MMIQGSLKKKPKEIFLTDLVAKDRNHNQIRIIIEEQDMAWVQGAIHCLVIRKVVSSWA